jgi:hypothetical protein
MLVTIKYTNSCDNDKQVYAILAKYDVNFIETRSEGNVYLYTKYTTFRIKDQITLNKMMLEINQNTIRGAEIINITREKTSYNFFKQMFNKSKNSRSFVGYVGQYSDGWLFETDTNSYSQQVCAAIDELMGEFSKDGDKFKIIIEKLGG